jgi:PAS domain S-box-containing protein
MDKQSFWLRKKLLPLIAAIYIGVIIYNGVAFAEDLNLSNINKQDVQKLLTAEEKDWLSKHKTIRIAGPMAFPPFHYFEKDGALKGMASDYINLIFKYLDLKPDIRSNLAWPVVLKEAQKRKIDLISCSAKTVERESYLAFTKSYLSFPLVIITRADAPFVGGLNDLHGNKVAFIKGAAAYDWIKKDNIKVTPYFVKTPLDALQAVSLGHAEAHIQNLAAATYLIQKHGLANLKIAAPTSYGNYNLYIAVRKDWPQLVSIINKILVFITPEQHTTIRNKWMAVTYEYGIHKADVIKWFLIIIGIAAAILVITLMWNRRLSREIDDRKKVEQALKESENRFRTLFEQAAVGVGQIESRSGRFIQVNQRYCDIVGYASKEIMQKKIQEITHPDDRSEDLRNMQEMMAGKIREFSLEKRYLRKDGSVVWVNLTVSPMWEVGQKPDNFIAIIEDITKKRQAELELVESEFRFRELFNNMGSGVAVYHSPDNGQSFVFKDLNRAGLEGTQKKKEEVVGQKVRDVFPGVETMGLFDVFKRVWKTGQPEHHPNSVYKDGRIFLWVENYVCKLPSGELVAIYEDTTARKKAEEAKESLERQLRQTQKLESIGNLAGGIAHDFNNILSAIIGYTELALYDVASGSKIEERLQEVLIAGKRARDLVKQILTFARQSDEEQKPIQVNKIAKEALKLIRSTIPTSIEIRKKIESDSLIMGNPTQVHQLFMNICTNAAQAMEENGGILEVGLKDIEITDKSLQEQSHLRPGLYMLITISDTGSGIKPDILEMVFEPYFTTKGVGEGTGMGLAMTHGIVEGCGGKITVKSELGQGTIFSVYLPITKKSNTYLHHEKNDIPTGNERILFVDDEMPIAEMSSLILKQLGYQVSARSSSIEALELFRARPNDFDLVITDMTMPNMMGDQLAGELMMIRPDIPIIICTGYSKKISDQNAADMGVKAFAYKPIIKADLAKTVRNVLDEVKR